LEKETKEQKLEIDSLKTKLNVIEQKLKEVQLKKNTVEDEYSHCADSDEELGFKKLFTI
jgi:RNA polymerase-binding transcription factor DksA